MGDTEINMKIVCSNDGTYTNSLIICNNDFAISLIIPVELAPQNLKDYEIGQQALITSETVIKAFAIVKIWKITMLRRNALRH